MTEPNLKASACSCECNEAKRRIGQKAKPQYREMDFLLRYARNAKERKGFASLAVATACSCEVKI